jgi:hypothetical protein
MSGGVPVAAELDYTEWPLEPRSGAHRCGNHPQNPSAVHQFAVQSDRLDRDA